jgi:hypothetical protein
MRRLMSQKQHFLTILARYARAKMEIEDLSLDQLARKIGASGRNWVYRVLAHDGDPKACGGHLEDPLIRLIDWVGFSEGLVCGGSEPGKEPDTYWGDIRLAIMHCVDIPEPIREKLWLIVCNWAISIEHYERRRCGCGEIHHCERHDG